MDLMKQMALELVDWFLGFLPHALKGLLIFVVGLYVAGKAKQLLMRTGDRLQWDGAVSRYLGNALRYLLIVVFLITALKAMGFPVNSLLAAFGVSGVIIGLGLRAQIANYFAGVMMMAARPFKEGDVIEFGPPPQIGVVRDVCMTYTALDGLDNVRVVVPNAVLWRNRIYNFSRHDLRAIRVPITIPYDIDVGWVKDIILDVLTRHEIVQEAPAPTFSIADVTATHVSALVVAWTKVDALNAFGDVVIAMRKEFEVANLAVVVPGKDVDLKREE